MLFIGQFLNISTEKICKCSLITTLSKFGNFYIENTAMLFSIARNNILYQRKRSKSVAYISEAREVFQVNPLQTNKFNLTIVSTS